MEPTDRDVIIITGGSRGIGAATAARLAERPPSDGLCLIVGYTSNEEAANATVEMVTEAGNGVEARAVRADVSVEAEVLALFEAADAAGRLVGLVNNAGIISPSARLETFTVERINEVMAVNVIGAFLCAREAVRRMSSDFGGSGGSIVNVSSRAATLGSPNEFIDYAATKGALDSMTVGLATEVGGRGIRVNSVRPGLIETDIHADSGDPGRVERLATGVPLGRPGEAGEVANLIAWLLSDEASYVSGALIDIGGGR